ncbi:MAG: 6-bladed beta-propeller [Desulfuromonas sp.]|nr:MAG: 6-bladed beta-propeller [Desulfuromonas sp.]
MSRCLNISVFCLSLLAFLIASCAPVEMKVSDWQDESLPETVWPDPPETPRIKLLRTIATERDLSGQEENGFLEWLIGDRGSEDSLVSPYGITADGSGKVWVADPGAGQVLVFDLARQEIKPLDPPPGLFFQSPVGVSYDPNNRRLYVSDSITGSVHIYQDSGVYVGILSPGNMIKRPAGMAVDQLSNLYVVDVLRGVVEVFSTTGKHVRSIGSKASKNGLFNRPSNVWVDQSGNIYIVDSLRFRVEIQSRNGELSGVLGGVGNAAGDFARPRGVAVDSQGHIYVSDAAFDNVQIFDMAGRLLLFFGSAGEGPGDMCLPAGLFIDSNDRIYVTEGCNQRFQVFQYRSHAE